MTDIAMGALNHGWNVGFAGGKMLTLPMNLAGRYRRWRQYRTTMAELRQYSPEQLTELGIGASDIGRIAEEAARS